MSTYKPGMDHAIERDATAPSGHVIEVTPSASPLTYDGREVMTRAIRVHVAGTLRVIMESGAQHDARFAAGETRALRVTHILQALDGASGIEAML